jgi:hypothetical protein
MNSSSSEQQSIAAKIGNIASVKTYNTQQVWENNAMQVYRKKGLTQGLTAKKSTWT